MLIGERARATDVGVETLRFHEREGLLPKSPRSASGYRISTLEAGRRVRSDDGARRARGKIGSIKERVRELKRMRRVLHDLERTPDEEDAMSGTTVELVYFDGCPNADEARENLAAVLEPGGWKEWNLSSPGTPKRFRRYGSPTVLVNGRDVTGGEGVAGALACRADGAPSAELIREALAGTKEERG